MHPIAGLQRLARARSGTVGYPCARPWGLRYGPRCRAIRLAAVAAPASLARLRGSFRPLPRRRPAVGNPTLAPAGGGCRSPSSSSDGVAARRRRRGPRPPRPGRRLGPARVDVVASDRLRDQTLLVDAAESRRPPVPATVAGRGFAPRFAAPPWGTFPPPIPLPLAPSITWRWLGCMRVSPAQKRKSRHPAASAFPIRTAAVLHPLASVRKSFHLGWAKSQMRWSERRGRLITVSVARSNKAHGPTVMNRRLG